MKMQILATRDITANVWGQPMFTPHIGLSIRQFGDECRRKDKDNVLGMHPEEFELWHIGEYDDNQMAESVFYDETKRVRIAAGVNYRE